MSLGMREFPPPLDLEARFGDMVRLVVVAGHDSHRFGQRLQPRDELRRVIVPQVVLGSAAQRREGEIGVRLLDGLAETLAAFVREVDAPRPVEGEVAEPLFQEILRGHAAGKVVRPGDVGDRRETLLEILRDGDDAVFAEQTDVVRVVELPDHGVGLHPHGPFDHRLYAELVAAGKGSTPAPCRAHSGPCRAAVRGHRLRKNRSGKLRVPWSGWVSSRVKIAFFREFSAPGRNFGRKGTPAGVSAPDRKVLRDVRM